MATCFCGCGQPVGRLPLGLRTVNRTGGQLTGRLETAQELAEQTRSPSAVDFAMEGRSLRARLAEHVHARRPPPAELAKELSDWQRRGRTFDPMTLDRVRRRMFLSREELCAAARRGELDPFA